MSHLDRSQNLLRARILFWGPPGSGKTAAIRAVRRFVDPEEKLRVYTICGADGGTRFFDFLPLEDFTYGSYRIRVRVMGVPGAGPVHESLLADTDAVVFVADSRADAQDANITSLRSLVEGMRAQGAEPGAVPVVWCLNGRDLPDAVPVSELSAVFGVGQHVHETVATDGRGIFEAFSDVFRSMMEAIAERHCIVGPDTAAALPVRLLPQLARGGKVVFDRPGDADTRTLAVELDEGDVSDATAALILMVEEHAQSDQTNRMLEGRNRELMSINRVARSILSAMEVDNLLVVLLDAIADYLGVTHASCVVFDPAEQGRLRSHVHGFGRDPVLALPAKEARYLFDLLQSSDGPIPASDEHNAQLLHALRRVDRRVQRALFQSIRGSRGRASGWLAIYTAADDAPLTTQRLLFLSSISRLAALGLEKIATLEELRSGAAHMESELADRNAKLELAKARVRALNRGLESRVTERTRAIEESVRELREKRAAAVHDARLDGMGRAASVLADQVGRPMAELLSGLEALRDGIDELRAGGTDPERTSDFEAVLDESRERAVQIADVVSSLQRFGGANVEDGEIDLNATLADAVTFLDDRIRACADVDLRLGNVPTVKGDVRQLGHVLLSVITNAVEAMEGRESRGRLALSTFASRGQVTVLVQDTGCGIDEPFQARVFEPFATTKADTSAGLGLYIAYETVKRHHGTLTVKSKPGEGTTAKIVLPVAAPVSDGADVDACADAAR